MIMMEMDDGLSWGSDTPKDKEVTQNDIIALLDAYEKIDGYSATRDFINDIFKPALKKMSLQDLTEDGVVLKHAIKKKYSNGLDYLISYTQDWPKDVIADELFKTAEEGNDTAFTRIIKLPHPEKKEILQKLNTKKDSYKADIQRSLRSAKAAFLGSEWHVIDAHQISHTIYAKTASVEEIFNFNAMSITTITSKEKALDIIKENFADIQDDTDVVKAYETLSIFEKPPAYRGHTYTPPRTVKKRDI